jgi:hypothetical protein
MAGHQCAFGCNVNTAVWICILRAPAGTDTRTGASDLVKYTHDQLLRQ